MRSRLRAFGEPPVLTAVWNAPDGRRNSAAVRALAWEIAIEAYCVPSIVAWAIRLPAGSTTEIDIFQLCFLASVTAAMIAFCASSMPIGVP